MELGYGRSQGGDFPGVGADRSKAEPEYSDSTNVAKNAESHSTNLNLEVHPISGLALREIRGENLDNLVYSVFMDSEEMKPEKIADKGADLVQRIRGKTWRKIKWWVRMFLPIWAMSRAQQRTTHQKKNYWLN